MTNTLSQAKAAYESAEAAFNAALVAAFPGRDKWDWQRAVAHMRGENIRRNDDTSQDEAMASHAGIRSAWDSYITKLHAFYLLRDGPRGVLGGKGL